MGTRKKNDSATEVTPETPDAPEAANVETTGTREVVQDVKAVNKPEPAPPGMQWLPLPAAANMMGVSIRTIERRLADGRFEARKVDGKREILIEKKDPSAGGSAAVQEAMLEQVKAAWQSSIDRATADASEARAALEAERAAREADLELAEKTLAEAREAAQKSIDAAQEDVQLATALAEEMEKELQAARAEALRHEQDATRYNHNAALFEQQAIDWKRRAQSQKRLTVGAGIATAASLLIALGTTIGMMRATDTANSFAARGSGSGDGASAVQITDATDKLDQALVELTTIREQWSATRRAEAQRAADAAALITRLRQERESLREAVNRAEATRSDSQGDLLTLQAEVGAARTRLAELERVVVALARTADRGNGNRGSGDAAVIRTARGR